MMPDWLNSVIWGSLGGLIIFAISESLRVWSLGWGRVIFEFSDLQRMYYYSDGAGGSSGSSELNAEKVRQYILDFSLDIFNEKRKTIGLRSIKAVLLKNGKQVQEIKIHDRTTICTETHRKVFDVLTHINLPPSQWVHLDLKLIISRIESEDVIPPWTMCDEITFLGYLPNRKEVSKQIISNPHAPEHKQV